MQQVWEQRRQQRTKSKGDAKFEIVFENENVKDPNQPKPHPRRRALNGQANGGATKGGKPIRSRKLPRSISLPETGKSPNEEFSGIDGRDEIHQDHVGQPMATGKNGSLNPIQLKRRANSYGGYPQPWWDSSAVTSPGAIGMCMMDPFDTCSVPLGLKESRYMNHYFQALSWRFTLPKKTWLRYAVHDPGLLHGVLAIAAAHYSFATTRGLSKDALFHHNKTINHVQRCLVDPDLRFSDGVIGAIGRMVICHLIFGNRQHFITHIEALRLGAQARGGLEALGMVGQLKYVIASVVAGAATIWWEDVPQPLRYPYGPLDYPAVEDVPDAEAHDPEWGTAFRELSQSGFLSDKMLDICEAMVKLNSVISSRRTWSEPQQRIFGDQCNKMSLRLVYLKEEEDAKPGEKTELDHMRECLRLTVHFYVTAFQRDVPLLSNLSIQTLHKLKNSLYLTDLETSWGGGQLGEVLLWVMIITASGCVRPQERHCAGAQLRETAMSLGVTEWLEVKRICRRFLFLDSAVEWKTWPLWKDFGPRSANDQSPIRPETSVSPLEAQAVVVH
jgi:Fungal specific transcription factor domain